MFWFRKRPRPQNTLLGNVLGGGLFGKCPQPLSEYQIFSEYKSNGAPRAMRSALFVVFFRRSISGANRIAAAKRAKNRLYFLSACAILYVRHNSISFSVHRYNRHYCISFSYVLKGIVSQQSEIRCAGRVFVQRARFFILCPSLQSTF